MHLLDILNKMIIFLPKKKKKLKMSMVFAMYAVGEENICIT